jgi:cyclase
MNDSRNKPRYRAHFLVAFVFVLAGRGVCQQPNVTAQPASVNVTKLSRHVHWLSATRPGSAHSTNVAFSSGPDGVLLVDGLTAALAGRIPPALKTAGGGPVRWLINTHWHNDHTGGNVLFGREAAIIAHPSVRQRLMTEQRPPWEK